MAIAGHKALLGPPGIGCLLVNNPELDLVPLLDGGTGHASEDLLPPVVLPTSFEAGTPNLPGIAGLGAALEFAATDDYTREAVTAASLYAECLRQISEMPSVHVYGCWSGVASMPIIALRVEGLAPHELAAQLDREYGIQARAGLHCAPRAHEAFGTYPEGTVRIAFGYGNTEETLERLCTALACRRH